MGRWTQYDEDERRLPEGMRRVGYDADTHIYTYQDEEGAYWEGATGARYGELRRAGDEYEPEEDIALLQTTSRRRSMSDDWRYLAPFFLLVCLFLLGVYTMLGGGDMLLGGRDGARTPSCAAGEALHKVASGETCWSIANGHGVTLAELMGSNAKLDCDNLQIGSQLCVPGVKR